jgi:hypothetical protein
VGFSAEGSDIEMKKVFGTSGFSPVFYIILQLMQ